MSYIGDLSLALGSHPKVKPRPIHELLALLLLLLLLYLLHAHGRDLFLPFDQRCVFIRFAN